MSVTRPLSVRAIHVVQLRDTTDLIVLCVSFVAHHANMQNYVEFFTHAPDEQMRLCLERESTYASGTQALTLHPPDLHLGGAYLGKQKAGTQSSPNNTFPISRATIPPAPVGKPTPMMIFPNPDSNISGRNAVW